MAKANVSFTQNDSENFYKQIISELTNSNHVKQTALDSRTNQYRILLSSKRKDQKIQHQNNLKLQSLTESSQREQNLYAHLAEEQMNLNVLKKME